MNELITVVQNNFGYDLDFTCKDSAGVVVNLTGSTLTFTYQNLADGSINSTGNMVIVGSPTLGTCKYTVQNTDFTVAGSYSAQINVNYGSGTEIITFPGININVVPKLPQ